MLHHCYCAVSQPKKRWLSAVVGLQCLLLLIYLFFTHSPTEREKRPHSSTRGNRTSKESKTLSKDTGKDNSFVTRNSIKHQNSNSAKINSRLIGNSRSNENAHTNARHQDMNPESTEQDSVLHETPSEYQTGSKWSSRMPKPSDSVFVEIVPQPIKNQSVFTANESASEKKQWYQREGVKTSNNLHNPLDSQKWTFTWPPRGTSTKEGEVYKLNARHSRQFSRYDLLNPPSFTLVNDTVTEYVFRPGPNTACMTYGTHRSNSSTAGGCSCREGWTGLHCSIPDNVASSFSFKHSYSRSDFIDFAAPRRVINGLTFNIEWDLLETRMNELGLVVDLFVIIESNYSMYGEPKPLRLLERLRKGYLKQYHHKIMYVFLDHFATGGKEDGSIAERYQRNYMSQQCLQRLKGHLPSDLFMNTDADEIPSFESVLFLKLHTGYTEPVGFFLGWSVYGFFWKNNNPTHIMSVCTMKFLADVLQGDVTALRTTDYIWKYQEALAGYKRNSSRPGGNNNVVSEWYIGESSASTRAGWHCSWCLPVEHIRIKLTSAVNADFPRWGDYPSKRELPYIRQLVQTGMWFDDESKIDNFVEFQNDTSYAPTYLLTHYQQYRSILNVKYVV